ncbi:MAG: type II secretion system protein [Candidatus Omnitrophota bacterium]
MNKAFTIIELIVVLGIICLILGLTTAHFFNFKTASALKIEALNILSVLNQARSLAITNQENYKVVFDLINNKFVIKDNLDVNVEIEKNLNNGISIDRTTFSMDTVIFNAQGGLSGARGKIFIKNSANKFYTINIENTTGRIKIYNFEQT